jgi:hypothetical protein
LMFAFQSYQLCLLTWWSVCIWTNTCHSKSKLITYILVNKITILFS